MQAASNINEFNEQARAFVTKAKDKGLSNTAIANTINFMYGMYQNDQKNKITPAEQARLDLDREKWDYAKSQAEKSSSFIGTWQLIDTDSDGIVDTEFNSTTGEKRPYNSSLSLAAQANGSATGDNSLSGSNIIGDALQPSSDTVTRNESGALMFRNPAVMGDAISPGLESPGASQEKAAQEEAARREAEKAAQNKLYQEEGLVGVGQQYIPGIKAASEKMKQMSTPIGFSGAVLSDFAIPAAQSGIEKLGSVVFGKKGPRASAE